MSQTGTEPILEIESLAFAYRDKPVLSEINLGLVPGRILALLGPNGAGKSTLIRCICGRLQPDAGRVRVVGRNPLDDAKARAAMGLVPQQIALYPHLTVTENLAAFARLAGVEKKAVAAAVAETVEICYLESVATRPAGQLSGGWQRRVNIGCAMSHSPRLLILDEPTVGIDPPARVAIEQLLTRLAGNGLAVLMSSHDLPQLETLSHSVAFMSEGRITATGAPWSLIREFFGARRDCRVSLAAPPDTELVERLVELGLASGGYDGLEWTGLLDEQQAWNLQPGLPADAPISELRVRRPGLDSLWKHLYGRDPEQTT